MSWAGVLQYLSGSHPRLQVKPRIEVGINGDVTKEISLLTDEELRLLRDTTRDLYVALTKEQKRRRRGMQLPTEQAI